MSGRLDGKRAFVTAAGQGIGRAVVEAYVAEGAQVVATDLNVDLMTDWAGHDQITVAKLDALDGEAIKATAVDVGAVDILYNTAGFVHHGSVLEATEAEWDFAFDLNVKSMFRLIQAFLPAMIENGGGSIVNTASVSGSIKGIPMRFIYGATKAAVIGLTKSVAADFVSDKVRCNAIAPGTVDTPSLGDRINAFDDPVQARKDFIARQPLGRLGTAEEIGAMAVYLGSDEASFITGQTFIIDGGITV